MIKIVLIIIIILLLIRNCALSRENGEYQNNPIPGENVDIIEIKCDNNRCQLVPKPIESITFNQKNVSVKLGETITLIPIIKPSAASSSKLTWTSSDPSIATVDSNGVVKGVSIGKVTITVTSPNGKKATCTVEVVKDAVNVKKITLTPEESTIQTGSVTQINATIEPENATNRDLVWTSSDPSIATVDSKGIVKGLKAGTVTITAKTKDGKVVATTTITVENPAPPEVESIEFAQNNVSVKQGGTITLIPTIKPSAASSNELTWTSSDPSIATVDANGVVTGVNVGTVTITVTSSNGKKATCTVNVTTDTVAVEEIILTPNDNIIGIGDTTQVIVEIRPSNATNRDLVWTSSDPTVATVNSNGVVNGVKAGTVTITAKTTDGSVVATTTITVIDDSGEFEVYDNDHTPITWNGAMDLKIFTKTAHTMEGKIAPESANAYQFVVRNDTNYGVKYSISFIETNNYHINMKYKLKKNNTYIIDHYVSAGDLDISDMLLDAKASDVYYLEWKWISSSNDTSIGQNPEAKYGLKIEIEAEGTNG